MPTMIDRHQRKQQREKNKDELSNILNKSDEIIGRTVDPIQKRHEDIRKQIVELHEKKQRLLEKPISKEEFLKMAKDNLLSERKRCMERIVKPHLEVCHAANFRPFTGNAFRTFGLTDSNMVSLFAFAITDEDVERVLGPLPEIGISQRERDSQVKKIDNEIEQLVKSLENELGEIKK